MTPADVRARLTHALRLDLIGPEPGELQEAELLRLPPSRWYLTGFLVPWNAPSAQKSDEDEQGELELAAAGAGADDDDSAARQRVLQELARDPVREEPRFQALLNQMTL